MKKIFQTPEIKVITLAVNDVIATSGDPVISVGNEIGEGDRPVDCD